MCCLSKAVPYFPPFTQPSDVLAISQYAAVDPSVLLPDQFSTSGHGLVPIKLVKKKNLPSYLEVVLKTLTLVGVYRLC